MAAVSNNPKNVGLENLNARPTFFVKFGFGT